ncbi:hypothetical protein NG798_14210 [Ancylothrix sp. C2]|uniref:hypothetical protein n=1 Tax=Ancylothrix sp. D3o TaxID=2953691 RepID=UPI0021BB1411|nr:hypothetical protein [Ancylothrix sp. D3o]MCT7950949.1 hypothetical protein [Ancylothrix sp. D3o]
MTNNQFDPQNSPEFAEPVAPQKLDLQLNLPPAIDFVEEKPSELEIENPASTSKNKPVLGVGFLLRVSTAASHFFAEAAKIDRDSITDWQMKPARIYTGLTFTGFSALGLVLLMFYISRFHPEFARTEWVKYFWYQYILLVSLGVAGMSMLGREALRRPLKEQNYLDERVD